MLFIKQQQRFRLEKLKQKYARLGMKNCNAGVFKINRPPR